VGLYCCSVHQEQSLRSGSKSRWQQLRGEAASSTQIIWEGCGSSGGFRQRQRSTGVHQAKRKKTSRAHQTIGQHPRSRGKRSGISRRRQQVLGYCNAGLSDARTKQQPKELTTDQQNQVPTPQVNFCCFKAWQNSGNWWPHRWTSAQVRMGWLSTANANRSVQQRRMTVGSALQGCKVVGKRRLLVVWLLYHTEVSMSGTTGAC